MKIVDDSIFFNCANFKSSKMIEVFMSDANFKITSPTFLSFDEKLC